jgi:hypothetical protein
MVSATLDRAWSLDSDATRTELETALLARGYRLIPMDGALAGESAPSHKVPSGVAE